MYDFFFVVVFRGVLNVHGSILPQYRGAAPIQHAILNGDNSTGITIMEIQPFHFDIGPIFATEECIIEPDETSSELSVKMANIGANLLLKVLEDLPKYTASKRSQPQDNITYAPKITKVTIYSIGKIRESNRGVMTVRPVS